MARKVVLNLRCQKVKPEKNVRHLFRLLSTPLFVCLFTQTRQFAAASKRKHFNNFCLFSALLNTLLVKKGENVLRLSFFLLAVQVRFLLDMSKHFACFTFTSNRLPRLNLVVRLFFLPPPKEQILHFPTL